MAAGELFLAINPDPTKHSVQLDKTRYELMRSVILSNLLEHGPLTVNQLSAMVQEQLQDEFDGSVMWYFTTVKLDLEARGEIRRVPKAVPYRLELIGGR